MYQNEVEEGECHEEENEEAEEITKATGQEDEENVMFDPSQSQRFLSIADDLERGINEEKGENGEEIQSSEGDDYETMNEKEANQAGNEIFDPSQSQPLLAIEDDNAVEEEGDTEIIDRSIRSPGESSNDEEDNDQIQSTSQVKRKTIVSDDEEEGNLNEGRKIFKSTPRNTDNVGELMANIFGDDVDSDVDEQKSKERVGDDSDAGGDDQVRVIRIDGDEEEIEDSYGRKWDFDVMMNRKKGERKRRRRKDGSIDLISDADDHIKELVDAMTEAANDDRVSNMDKRPAIRKLKMLPLVRSMLLRADWFDPLLDNGMISAVSEWLAPLPDKSLTALEVRTTLLKILDGYPQLEQGILKQSGLGKAVMILMKHPKEIKDNKSIASRLIREWSRPIFQSETDIRSLTREERVHRDFSQMPAVKRQRLRLDPDGLPIPNSPPSRNEDNRNNRGEAQQILRPGEKAIARARVPKPSTRDYVIRPKPEIEGTFRGQTKNKEQTMLDKKLRQFRERSRQNAVKRVNGVSIEGTKMGL